MSNSHLNHLMEHADDLIPVLYEHARLLAARKLGWHQGKTLPLGKSPEDVVREVYVSYARGAGSGGRRMKGVRHFDPNKDLMLQLKGAIRSTLWALTQRSSSKNEKVADADEEDSNPIEFAPTDPSPAEQADSGDFAKAVVKRVMSHPKFKTSQDLQNLVAAFELEMTEVPDQAVELGKSSEEVCQLRYQLRRIYSEVIDELNRE